MVDEKEQKRAQHSCSHASERKRRKFIRFSGNHSVAFLFISSENFIISRNQVLGEETAEKCSLNFIKPLQICPVRRPVEGRISSKSGELARLKSLNPETQNRTPQEGFNEGGGEGGGGGGSRKAHRRILQESCVWIGRRPRKGSLKNGGEEL